MDHWSRRQFVQGMGVAGLGLLAGCGRLPGQGPPPKMPRIGLLYAAGASGRIERGLQDLGYRDGQNYLLESRVAEGQTDVLPELAAQLVGLEPAVIVTTGTIATVTAKNATSTIPIVQAAGGGDLVREGIVASLARPSGNVTGLTEISPELSGKRLEQLQQAVPGLTRVAVLWDPADPLTVYSFDETQAAGQALGIQLQSLEVRSLNDLQIQMEAASRARAEAMLLLTDPLTVAHGEQIAALAAASQLPSMFDRRQFAAAGGLMSYGPDAGDLQRRAATYVDKILKGANPGDLPIERPTRFEFVINLKTAQALGLTIPPHVLLQATEVIQ
jgi:putative ABC transport system substrate-binding protein